MSTPCSWGVSGLLATLLLAPAALGVTEQWSKAVPGHPDGMALGDIDADGRREIAVVTRGGTYDDEELSTGSGVLTILDASGAVRLLINLTAELAGYPTFADIDGDGRDELAVCEMARQGYCRVFDEDGSERYATGPLFYPGASNSGPAAADLNDDGAQDFIFVSWGGEVVAADGPTGEVLWSADVWTDYDELISSCPVLGDLDGDGDLELVFGGYRQGGLYVLDAATGELAWREPSLVDRFSNYFYASSPLLVDLDGDDRQEVVVALHGPEPAVLAFGSDGALRWRLPLPGHQLVYTNPTAADLDGDGAIEIEVVDGQGQLLVIEADASATHSVSLGGESWMPSSFLSVTSTGAVRLLASSLDTLRVIDGKNLTTVDQYDMVGSGFLPQPLVADLDLDGRDDILVGGWDSQRVVALTRNGEPGMVRWPSLGGSSWHSGVLQTEQSWWDLSWRHRRRVRFDRRGQGEALVDFPVSIRLDSSRIDYSRTRDRGQDLRFVDADGTTQLPHEIETWNESGTSVVWLRVPRIDADTDQDYVWMYYDNPAAADRQRKTEVWSSGFDAVYHLNGTLTDSTSHAYNGANHGTASAVGVLGNGRDFDGTHDWIDLGSRRDLLTNTGGVTLSTWTVVDSAPRRRSAEWLISLSVGNHRPTADSRATLGLTTVGRRRDRALELVVGGRAADREPLRQVTTATQPIALGGWHYLATVIDYTNDRILLYVDGALHGRYDRRRFRNRTTPATLSRVSALGAQDDGSGGFFDGRLDEVRISRVVRSAAWIQAEYQSMKDEAVAPFVRIDPEQAR